MFKKLNKKGSLSLQFALIIPFLLLVMFIMFDVMNYSQIKQKHQRQLDSAVLTIANSAMPADDVLVDGNGFIIENGQATNKTVCMIKDSDYQKGIEQLKKMETISSVPDKNAIQITNISTQEQLDSGVIRIQAKGYIPVMMSSTLSGLDIQFPFLIESYATCYGQLDYSDRYVINYVTNGGTLANSKDTYKKGESFTLPVPTRDGHTFLGWYKNPNFTERVVSIHDYDTGDKIFYAKWS